jgi:hypothetical protein
VPSFLSPLFLVGALAAAIPVVLHLLKRNPEPRVKFAAVALLRDAPVEHTSTRRLRQIILLMLRVAALVLLALAFARPFFSAAAASAAGGATIILLDTSFSLSAPGRFARAQQLARDAVAQAPGGNDVAVVTFSDRAELAQPLSPDRALAVAAIDAASPGFGGTRYLAGLNVAGQALASRPATRAAIIVVTDLQENGWDAGDRAAVPESARVDIRDVGILPANLAVAGLRAAGDRVVATIRNTGTEARQTAVRLSIDGRSAGETTVSVGPAGSAEAVFAGVSGTEAIAALDDRDGLQADNVRYALINGVGLTAVLVVTATGHLDRDAFYVRQALAAGAPGSSTLEVTGVAANQIGGWPDTRLPRYAAVLMLSTSGLDRRGREMLASYLAAGGALLLAAGPDVDADVIAGVFGPGARVQIAAATGTVAERRESLAPADIRHPIFQSFGPSAASLGLVTFRQAARISGPGCQTLAKFTSGDAAVIDCGSGQGRAVIVASDLNNRWNDFPLHATFVPFLHETVRYLSNAGAGGNEYLVGDVPAGVAPAPGIVTMPDSSATRPRRVAVNVDPRESEPARLSIDDFQAAIAPLQNAGVVEARAAVADQESRQHLWQYLLAVMLIALAVEGIVASRTV